MHDTTLKRLDVSGCKICHNGRTDGLDDLCSIYTHLPHANQTLTDLNLASNGLDDRSVAILTARLLVEEACQLRHIDLRGNDIGRRGHGRLAAALGANRVPKLHSFDTDPHVQVLLLVW